MDISIIFSTRDRPEILQRTLDAMSVLDSSDIEFEVIVGDNGSTDSTASLLERYRVSLPLVSFNEPTPGKNRCLNRAIDMARGELLIFTDDDVLPSEDWLVQYASAADRWPNDSVFGGPIDLDFPGNAPAWIREIRSPERVFAFSSFAVDHHEGPMSQTPNGPNMMIRRAVFDDFRYNESIGPAGSSYAMGSETELLGRLRSHGLRFIYVPDATVDHQIRSEQLSLDWLAGRAERLGRGQVALAVLAGKAVWPLFFRSILQLVYVLPAVILTLGSPPGRRFLPVWHRRKAIGRLKQLMVRSAEPL